MVLKIFKRNKIIIPKKNLIAKTKNYLILLNEFPTEISRINEAFQFIDLFNITHLPNNQYKIELKDKI